MKEKELEHKDWLTRLLTKMAYNKGLYVVCAIMIWGMWYLMGVCSYIAVVDLIANEWVRTGIALAIVGSSFAILYLVGIAIPTLLWDKNLWSKK